MKAEMSVSVKEEIAFGLQKLLALQLERSPAAEMLKEVGRAAGGVAGASAPARPAGAGNQPGAARGKSRLPGRPACWDTDARE